jgi:hypothetical protein
MSCDSRDRSQASLALAQPPEQRQIFLAGVVCTRNSPLLLLLTLPVLKPTANLVLLFSLFRQLNASPVYFIASVPLAVHKATSFISPSARRYLMRTVPH